MVGVGAKVEHNFLVLWTFYQFTHHHCQFAGLGRFSSHVFLHLQWIDQFLRLNSPFRSCLLEGQDPVFSPAALAQGWASSWPSVGLGGLR